MNLKSAGSRPMSGPTQHGGANPHDPEAKAIGDRIEAASKAVPEPKGKGLVMILLAIAVLGALAWEFSGQGAASKATREAVERERREKEIGEKDVPLARDNPEDPAPRARPDAPPPPASTAPTVEITLRGMKATLPPALAVSAWVETPEDEREALRLSLLEALVPLAKQKGRSAQEAFEAAAWLLEGAGEDAMEAILHLTNATPAALEDDRSAQAAILFLTRVPDGIDKRTALSLDGVIADSTRPLAVRLAAARARPKDGQSKRVRDLIDDPMTHPALRDALK